MSWIVGPGASSLRWFASQVRPAATFALLASGSWASQACGSADEAVEGEVMHSPVELPQGFTQEDFLAGQEVYSGAGLCFSCHAPNGRGGFLGPDLTDKEWVHIDGSIDQIAGIIAGGVGTPVGYPEPMPAMGGSELGDTAIRSLALYVWTLSQGEDASGGTPP